MYWEPRARGTPARAAQRGAQAPTRRAAGGGHGGRRDVTAAAAKITAAIRHHEACPERLVIVAKGRRGRRWRRWRRAQIGKKHNSRRAVAPPLDVDVRRPDCRRRADVGNTCERNSGVACGQRLGRWREWREPCAHRTLRTLVRSHFLHRATNLPNECTLASVECRARLCGLAGRRGREVRAAGSAGEQHAVIIAGVAMASTYVRRGAPTWRQAPLACSTHRARCVSIHAPPCARHGSHAPAFDHAPLESAVVRNSR